MHIVLNEKRTRVKLFVTFFIKLFANEIYGGKWTYQTRLTCINHAICYNYHRYLGCRLHIEFDCV